MSEKTVECYSGQCYADRPRAFRWQQQRRLVDAVLSQWRSPEGPVFRVRSKDQVYVLIYNEAEDTWQITLAE